MHRLKPVSSGPPGSTAPEIVDLAADAEFRKAALAMGWNPDSRWVGGYVQYEWDHGRHVFETIGTPVSGARVLEFGCNFGATSVVLAALGASVLAVDVDAETIDLARLNVQRYGLANSIDIRHVADTRQLPISDGTMDIVSCNSVLEYVPHDILPAVQREIARVLRPGGAILIMGTSSRLCPREVHSGVLGTNWLPRFVDRITGRSPQRGVWPWELLKGFGPEFENADLLDGCQSYLEAKRRMGVSPGRLHLLRSISRVSVAARVTPGLLTPSVSVTLVKRGMNKSTELPQ